MIKLLYSKLEVPLYNLLIDFIQYVLENLNECYEKESCKLLVKDIDFQSSRKQKTAGSRYLDDINSKERLLDPRKQILLYLIMIYTV